MTSRSGASSALERGAGTSSDGSRIQVLLVNDHLGYDGKVLHGVARLFLQWVPALREVGCDATICILREKNELHRYFAEKGIEVRFLGRNRFSPATLLDIGRLADEHDADLLHVQGYGGANFGRVAGLLANLPVLVHWHDTSPYYPWYQRLADAFLNPMATETLAVSESVRQYIKQNRTAFGLRNEIQVLHNCTSLEEFRPASEAEQKAVRRKHGIGPSTKVVGTVTRLFRSKGNHHFLKAAARIAETFPDCIFLVAGDGPEMKRLRSLASELEISEQVRFLGFHGDIREVFVMMDVMVIASYAGEGVPLAGLEAMAMGKPIVTTDLVEVIDDGVTGLVVPPKEPDLLFEAVVRLLSDADLARHLATRARDHSQNFDTRAYVRRLAGIYRRLLSESGVSRT